MKTALEISQSAIGKVFVLPFPDERVEAETILCKLITAPWLRLADVRAFVEYCPRAWDELSTLYGASDKQFAQMVEGGYLAGDILANKLAAKLSQE